VLLTIGSCTNIAPVTVSVLPKPTLMATATPSIICPGYISSIAISGSGNSYSINGVSAGPLTVVTPTNTTMYSIGTTGSNGCTAFTTALIMVTPAPSFSVSANPANICPGQPAFISSTGATITMLNGSPVFTNNIQVTPLTNTTYTAIGLSSTGCTVSSQVSVGMLPVPTIFANLVPPTICKGEKAVLILNGIVQSYSVNSAASPSSLTVIPNITTSYLVEGMGSSGCIGKTTVTLTVDACTGINEQDEARLLVYPNPNNGSFTIQNSNEGNLEIYNETGQHIRTVRAATNGSLVEGLKPGIYFITGEAFRYKVVVTD
jgi:hypothetical protein